MRQDWVNIYEHTKRGWRQANHCDTAHDAAVEWLDGYGPEWEYVHTMYMHGGDADRPFVYTGWCDIRELAREIEQNRRETAEHERQEIGMLHR